MKENAILSVTWCSVVDPSEPFSWGVGIHETYVLHHVTSGKGYFERGDKKYTLQKGDSFLIVPGDIVRYYPDSEEPWKYKWVNFIGSDVPLLLSMTDFYKNPICQESSDLSNIYSEFSRDFRYEYVKQRNNGLLRILLAHYIEVHPRRNKTHIIDNLSLAKNYVEANSHRHQFNVAELSKEIGLERSYLYRLFINSEGVSPSNYITNTRLRKAALLMKNGISQIKFISYSVGYEDPLYFSRQFKKKYGMTPSEYIKQLNLNAPE